MEADTNVVPSIVDALLHYAPLLNTLILIILGWMMTEFRSIRRDQHDSMKEVNTSLKLINGNVRELNQWRIDHDRRVEDDDRNHVLTRQQCQELHAERLRSVNERISEIWTRIGDRRRPKSEATD